MTQNEMKESNELSSDKVIELLRDIVENLLEKDVHPKVITYTMTFVAAELGYLSAQNKQDVYPILLEGIVQASASINEDQSTSTIPVETNEEEILEWGNETLH
jgi:hypothetical protein